MPWSKRIICASTSRILRDKLEDDASQPKFIITEPAVGDQAVKEYELPAKMHRLTDGRKALEWYLGSGQRVAPVKCAGPGYESGIGVSQTGQQYYEINLHLTFTSNDILSTWSKDQIGLHVRRPSNDGNLIMLSGTTVCALGLNG
jgi:hypothetical protein